MKQEVKFNDILNTCLDRLFKGESVEQCLQSYPEQAKELEPLLRTATAARVFSTVQPRPEFKAKARYEFMSALRDMEEKKDRKQSLFGWKWRWQSGWAIALIVVILIVAGGGGTVAAASGSMPDSVLYPVKLATEKVQLALASSDISKAELNAKFADRRAEEIVYLVTEGNAQEVQTVVARLNTNLENISNSTGSEVARENGVSFDAQNGNFYVAGIPSEISGESTQMFGAAGVTATDNAAPQPAAAVAPTTVASSGKAFTVPAAVQPSLTSLPSEVPAAPPATVQRNQSPGSNLANSNILNNKVLSPRLAKLKRTLEEKHQARLSILKEALEKASPDVRPAIKQAIADSEAEFEKSMRYLDTAGNSD